MFLIADHWALVKKELNQGASKNKISDIELFIKTKWKIDLLTPKAQRKFFSPMNLDPTTSKKFIFLIFFSKNFVYSIKDIYVPINLRI
jgi:hypothetical protein